MTDTSTTPYPVVPAKYDHVGAIMAYEQGDMDHDEILELFQYLVTSGLAWQLQGHYGRTAQSLLNDGLIHP